MSQGHPHGMARLLAATLLIGLLGAPHHGHASDSVTIDASMPKILNEASIEQKLGAKLPLELAFKDEAGRDVQLKDYFGKHPVVLVMAYYECPMLCTLVLNGVVKALNVLNLRMAQDYEVVTVSFDPGETPALAAAKKATYVQEYHGEGAEQGWHFLTGGQDAIVALADAVGFRYSYDPKTDEYAHASGIMVATPDGRLSKYFYGVEYSGRDLRLGLVDAADKRIGTAVDQIMLWCYHYDPLTGRYGLAIISALRLVALMTVVAVGAFMIRSLRQERRIQTPGVVL
ncbi:MAG: SCO family protein [Verrucomicrobia bacterium]|nr:SCO family protein [Verrucomicrobiota bacterium]